MRQRGGWGCFWLAELVLAESQPRFPSRQAVFDIMGLLRSCTVEEPHPTPTLAEWERQEDARPEALFYDAQREQLLTAAARPTMWEHRAVRSTHGHRGRLCAALYNSAFHVVSEA